MNNIKLITFDNPNISDVINLKANEELTLITFNKGLSTTSYKLEANMKKSSTLHIYNIITTSYDSTIEEIINMNEENGFTEIINLFLGNAKSSITSNIKINHNKALTTSNLEIYAIAKDEAKININNNAYIKNGSHKAMAHQKAKGLSLSKKAIIKGEPNLFIDDYDVIASHACAIGSINQEDLFYLMSRGLSEEEASKLIVMGFVSPILDKIENEELNKEIKNKFIEKL